MVSTGSGLYSTNRIDMKAEQHWRAHAREQNLEALKAHWRASADDGFNAEHNIYKDRTKPSVNILRQATRWLYCRLPIYLTLCDEFNQQGGIAAPAEMKNDVEATSHPIGPYSELSWAHYK